MRTRMLPAVPALLIGAVALTGCGGQAGSAALVDGDVITQNTVQQATAEVIDAAAAAGGAQVETTVIATEQVRRLVEMRLVEELAEREGIAVTPSEVDASIAEVAAQVGGRDALDVQLAAQAGVPPTEVESFVRTFLQKEALIEATGQADRNAGEAQLIADLGELSTELDVEVSPRYGTWNAESARVGEHPLDLAAPPSPAA